MLKFISVVGFALAAHDALQLHFKSNGYVHIYYMLFVSSTSCLEAIVTVDKVCAIALNAFFFILLIFFIKSESNREVLVPLLKWYLTIKP